MERFKGREYFTKRRTLAVVLVCGAIAVPLAFNQVHGKSDKLPSPQKPLSHKNKQKQNTQTPGANTQPPTTTIPPKANQAPQKEL